MGFRSATQRLTMAKQTLGRVLQDNTISIHWDSTTSVISSLRSQLMHLTESQGQSITSDRLNQLLIELAHSTVGHIGVYTGAN